MCQTEIVDGDLAENMRRAESAIREAAKQRADLACLPEAADWGWLYEYARRDAFPIPGKYTNYLSKIAAELKIWVCAGCLEKDDNKTYNSAVLIDRTGKIVLKHRKINTLKSLTEMLYYPGVEEELKVVDTELGRVGITVCADNFRRQIPQKVADLGAWLLITPHGFAAEQKDLEGNAASYQKHIKGIAKRTGMWVIGTNTCLGPIKAGAWKGRPHSGCSTLARPDGSAAVVAKFNAPDLVVFTIPSIP
jgi:predicted amidohydrolase